MDFCHPFEQGEVGYDNETNTLLIVDVATDFRYAYPVPNRSAEHVVASIQHFTGHQSRKIKLIYSDRAPEFSSAAAQLGVPFEGSPPGVPQANGFVESRVKQTTTGTRCALVGAGLPNVFWSRAAQHFCHAMNIKTTDGSSP